MVFYNGRAPYGKKTEWKMNEYKISEGDASSSSSTTAIPSVYFYIRASQLESLAYPNKF